MRAKDLHKLRKCADRDLRHVILGAARSGFRYRMTKSGVMFYGENGESVAVHFTNSDHRALKNAVSNFRKIGYEPVKKGQ